MHGVKRVGREMLPSLFHNTSVREHLMKLHGSFRTDKMRYFAQRITNLWNLLPQVVVMATNLDGLKRGLDKLMENRSVNGFQSL